MTTVATISLVLLATNLATLPAFSAESVPVPPKPSVSTASVIRGGNSIGLVIHRPLSSNARGTVVLIRGFPGAPIGKGGADRQRSLAASLANAGYAVVQFNYAGTWANEGQFTWIGGVEDAEAIVQFLQQPEAETLGVDGSRIVLVGHSYGGWVALTVAARNPGIRCVATSATANLGRTGQLMRNDRALYRRRITDYQEMLGRSETPIRAESGKALADEVMEHATSWDLRDKVDQLRSKHLLFVSAGNDTVAPKETFLQPVLDSFARAGAPAVRSLVIDRANHNFDQNLVELEGALPEWITAECKF